EKELKRIQTNLLTIGSGLAGSEKRLSNREIKRLELLIDRLTEDLPKLSNFIYPVGHLQVARAVCRRAERETVRFMNEDLKFKNKSMPVLKYLNRLSDALFTMGRWINNKTGIEEEVWRGKF
ncbi:MAG: ATP:cob(I)alamin adenosyltransferase, partial [Candidatus Amesbacteria bacterium GW2011_GWA1_47_16]